jgi:hypothetical protein
VFTCTVRDVRPATADELEDETVGEDDDSAGSTPVVIH